MPQTDSTPSIASRSAYVERNSTLHDAEDIFLKYELGGLPARNIPIVEFVETSFRGYSSELQEILARRIVSKPAFTKLCEAYLGVVKTKGKLEESLYEPFAAIINHILKESGSRFLYIVTAHHNMGKGGGIRKDDRASALRR